MSLTPSIIGSESSGKFLQTSPADAMMLIMSMEASFGDVSGPMRIAVPYYTMEPVLSRFLPLYQVRKPKLPDHHAGTKYMITYPFVYLQNGMPSSFPFVT